MLPQIDVFMDNGYTKEEMKMANETRKIMRDDSIRLTANSSCSCEKGGHSEAVNVEFEKRFWSAEIRNILNKTSGVVVVDDPFRKYPMPVDAEGKDEVLLDNSSRRITAQYTESLDCFRQFT